MVILEGWVFLMSEAPLTTSGDKLCSESRTLQQPTHQEDAGSCIQRGSVRRLRIFFFTTLELRVE